MATIHGDWFHSRSSSNLSELLSVRKFVMASRQIKFVGLTWSGGRFSNDLLYEFANVSDVSPSAMQTKIRAMIRYGFIKEGNSCPLIWTRMGELWNDLYTVSNFIAADKIYKLTLSISIAIYSFNDSQAQFSLNPSEGQMPLKFLFQNLNNGEIEINTFNYLVDGNTNRVGNNSSYWKRDLLNSGLFAISNNNGSLFYTGEFQEFINDLVILEFDNNLTNDDWNLIRNNPIIEISPFKDSIRLIFEQIINQNTAENELIEEILTSPLVDVISEQEEIEIPEIDILSTDTKFSTSTRRIRNSTWSLRIKKKYNYICAVPNCDVAGKLFVESAHIKPDNVSENEIPHRAHILNGVCLCRHCHVAFDNGLFSLNDNSTIITSEQRFSEINDQNIKRVILSSNGIRIKDRLDNRLPLEEFIQYHRIHKYRI